MKYCRLYKYRSLDRLDWVYDILLNNRLHCCNYIELNDPFEGQFKAKYLKEMKRRIFQNGRTTVHQTYGIWGDLTSLSENDELNDLVGILQKKTICSLSSSLRNILLWSHYAASHTGIAIELKVPAGKALKVSYNNKKELLTILHGPGSIIVDKNINDILTTKTHHWKYEREYRIIANTHKFELEAKIERVYCGERIDKSILLQMNILFPSIEFVEMSLLDKHPWLDVISNVTQTE